MPTRAAESGTSLCVPAAAHSNEVGVLQKFARAAGLLGDRRVTVDVRDDAGWDWYRDGIYHVFKPRT